MGGDHQAAVAAIAAAISAVAPSGCTTCLARGLSRCFCRVKGTTVVSAIGSPLVEEDSPLARARLIARQGRDNRPRGADALVNLWREVSKPRKGGAIPPQPAGCLMDSSELFGEWLRRRGLEDALQHTGKQKGWDVYRYTREPIVQSQPNWEQAFHGTWWYAVWLILESGIFLESDDKGLGHDFWEPGCYCSPSLDTGLWYARPQVLFNDGVYHRVIFELRVDPERRKKNRARGGIQWVFPCAAVSLHAVWVRSNAPPNNGEERVYGWQPELEALPPERSVPEVLVNTRTTAWPDMIDPEPFIGGWLGSEKRSSGITAAAMLGENPDGPLIHSSVVSLRSVGGLYGHWLQKAKNGELHPGCAVYLKGEAPQHAPGYGIAGAQAMMPYSATAGATHVNGVSQAKAKPGLLKPTISVKDKVATMAAANGNGIPPASTTAPGAVESAAWQGGKAAGDNGSGKAVESAAWQGGKAAGDNGSGKGAGGDAWAAWPAVTWDGAGKGKGKGQSQDKWSKGGSHDEGIAKSLAEEIFGGKGAASKGKGQDWDWQGGWSSSWKPQEEKVSISKQLLQMGGFVVPGVKGGGGSDWGAKGWGGSGDAWGGSGWGAEPPAKKQRWSGKGSDAWSGGGGWSGAW